MTGHALFLPLKEGGSRWGSFAESAIANRKNDPSLTLPLQGREKKREGKKTEGKLAVGAAFADGCFFCFRRRIERDAAFIGLCGCLDSDGALVDGERDKIAWLDAGFFGDGLGNSEARFFNEYGHGKKILLLLAV